MKDIMRHSRQRDLIYEYIVSTKEHPTAEAIYLSLKEKEPSLSLGTVYRNLKLLENIGKVKKVISLNNVEHYDGNCSNHGHFVCRCCEEISDIENIEFDYIKELCSNSIKQNKIENITLTINGICYKCQSKGE